MAMNKLRCLRGAICLAGGLAGTFSGHAEIIYESLGNEATALDLFRLTCPQGTLSGRGTIQELTVSADPNVVTVQNLYPGKCNNKRVAVQHAPRDRRVSPTAIVSCGWSRPYSMSITKSNVGEKRYRAVITCRGPTSDLQPLKIQKKVDQ